MTKRYAIMGVQYCSEREIELAQTDCNPQDILAGFEAKTLMVYGHPNNRRSSVPKYTGLRIVDRGAD